MISLTSEQLAIRESVLAFLGQARPGEFFSVQGLAGTGKSVTLAALARELPAAMLVSPTGKAAAVLREKSGREVKTIHSAIYDFRGMVDDEMTGERRPSFAEKLDAGLGDRTILLDESSMVGESVARDLLATGARVVAFGDPGQLPPVRDRQFFAHADAELKTIHRQALGSPIIRQAHRVRNGDDPESDGDAFRLLSSTRGIDYTAFDVALCWRNATRRGLNRAIRLAHGRSGPTLLPGEPVMCLRNTYELGLFNGEIYDVEAPRSPGNVLRIAGHDVAGAVVEGFDLGFDKSREDDEAVPFALAYSATVHKFQGSEAPRVLILDEMPRGAERPRWLYTAVTRASESVTIIRPEGW